MGFPTKNDHFRFFGGAPIFGNTHLEVNHVDVLWCKTVVCTWMLF